MRPLLQRIARHSRQRPERPALADSRCALTYAELQAEIERLCAQLSEGQRIALLLGNSCAWAVLDLAILRLGATCIPVPPFFADGQLQHLLADARPDLIITDQPQRLAGMLPIATAQSLAVTGQLLTRFRISGTSTDPLPADTAKLTYTSGTTGRPKGVLLTGAAMEKVTLSLSEAVQASPDDRTLSLLPLSTLLENIGGLYAPLYNGAQACLPDLAECGMNGSSGVDPALLIAALDRFRPSSMIAVPQLLKVMVEAAEAGTAPPQSLRFVAVGGARTAPALIERARRTGLPVYEGYGLSETCSVVSLNLPGRERLGSTGRPLPHVRVRIADDGEVLVSGTLFSGYLGQADARRQEWHTGDLGHLDADGFLHITGRKSSAFATAYGRNLSPDWVEGELLGCRALTQAVVLGEGRPYNVAVLVPHPRASAAAVSAALFSINRRLPDYARVRRWIIAREPFSPRNGLANAAGAVDRAAVGTAYADPIQNLYQEEESHVRI